MEPQVSAAQAQAALHTVEQGRRRVVDEIDMPAWYWWGLGLGWVALGAVTDLGHPWLTAAGTLVFGAVHASAASRVLGGRRRSNRLSVRSEVVGPHVPTIVIATLLTLAAVTTAGALLLRADGAAHPVTIISVFVAALLILGGPRLLDPVRRRAMRVSIDSSASPAGSSPA